MSRLLAAQRALTVPGWVKDELWRRARATPSLDLRFADSKSLVDATTGQNLVTFTRASGATYVDSQGVIRPAVTNLQRHSEDFTQGLTPNNITLTANQETAPNGTLTADQFIETTATGLHVQEIVDHVFIAGTTYTFSCYAKSIGGRNFAPGFPTRFNSARFGFFNLSGSGSVVSTDAGVTASIQAVGNDWYRCSITSTCATDGGARVAVFIASGTSISYTGDNTKGLFLWGAQLELGSTATTYLPTGATINSAPRFDHNPLTGECLGLLVEEQRQNLLLRSEEFDNASWTKTQGSVTANLETAPNGAIVADKFVENTAAAEHFIAQTVSGLTLANNHTLSIYLKAAGRTALRVRLGASGNGVDVFVDLGSGVITSTGVFGTGVLVGSSITSVGNGWYRVSATAASSGGSGSLTPRLDLISGGTTNYTGDGTSGIYIWGAQLEAGSFPTSYIKTEAAAATRTADIASITTAGGNVRSLFTSFRSPASGTRPVVSLDDNTANERIEILTSGTDPKLLVTDGGSAVADLNGGTVTANVLARIAARFNTDDYAVSINGGTSQLDAAGALPTVNRIRIGSNQAGGYLSGSIARVAAWDSALPLLPSISQ